MNTKKLNNFLILIYLLLFSCCNPLDDGFNLQIFHMADSQLEDLLKKTSLDVKQHYKDGYISVLELNRYDSIPEFWFSYQFKDNVNSYIYNNNKRIVGYLTYNSIDFLLLSNIDNKSDFELFFYKFILPTKDNKRIRFLYYPENQYNSDDKGKPFPPIARDQRYVVYAYIDDSIKNVTSDLWVYERIFKKQ